MSNCVGCGYESSELFFPKVCPSCGTNQKKFKDEEKEERRARQDRALDFAEKYPWVSGPAALIGGLGGALIGLALGGWVVAIISGLICLSIAYTYPFRFFLLIAPVSIIILALLNN